MNSMEEKPFGPTIIGMKMPEDMIDELNADCEFVTRPENFHRFDYSKELIGQIKLQARMNELRLSPDIMPWFIEQAQNYITKHFNAKMSLDIQDAWYNRTMDHTEYNPHHVHPTSLITSVGYLKLPDNFKEVLTKPAHKNGESGALSLFYGELAPFITTQMNLIPSVGDFYIFPASVRHAVYPMPEELKGERRSFSINFHTDFKQ